MKRSLLLTLIIAVWSCAASWALTPREVRAQLESEGYWVDWNNTLDGFLYNEGNIDRTVTTIGCCWQPTVAVIEEAFEIGCELLICHEPLFYDDNTSGVENDPSAQRKRAILDQTGMVVYRSADFQDRLPQSGVRDRWRSALGLNGPLVGNFMDYVIVSEEQRRPVWAWAGIVAGSARAWGQPSVRVIGDPFQEVSRIATCTGEFFGPRVAMLFTNAELAIVSEVVWINDVVVPLENDFPVIVVDHAVHAKPGVQGAMEWMRSRWPVLDWHFLDNEIPSRIISARTPTPLPARAER